MPCLYTNRYFCHINLWIALSGGRALAVIVSEGPRRQSTGKPPPTQRGGCVREPVSRVVPDYDYDYEHDWEPGPLVLVLSFGGARNRRTTQNLNRPALSAPTLGSRAGTGIARTARLRLRARLGTRAPRARAQRSGARNRRTAQNPNRQAPSDTMRGCVREPVSRVVPDYDYEHEYEWEPLVLVLSVAVLVIEGLHKTPTGRPLPTQRGGRVREPVSRVLPDCDYEHDCEPGPLVLVLSVAVLVIEGLRKTPTGEPPPAQCGVACGKEYRAWFPITITSTSTIVNPAPRARAQRSGARNRRTAQNPNRPAPSGPMRELAAGRNTACAVRLRLRARARLCPSPLVLVLSVAVLVIEGLRSRPSLAGRSIESPCNVLCNGYTERKALSATPGRGARMVIAATAEESIS